MRVKKCLLVALLGSAKRDLKVGGEGATCVVKVDVGFLKACWKSVSFSYAKDLILGTGKGRGVTVLMETVDILKRERKTYISGLRPTIEVIIDELA